MPLSGLKPCSGEQEQVLVGMGTGEQQLDTPGIAHYHGPDLQELQADRTDLGAGQLSTGQCAGADCIEQRIGERR